MSTPKEARTRRTHKSRQGGEDKKTGEVETQNNTDSENPVEAEFQISAGPQILPRIELEIRKLEAMAVAGAPAQSWSEEFPRAGAATHRLPDLDTTSLAASFTRAKLPPPRDSFVKAPSKTHLLVFCRSNGVMPLISDFLVECDHAVLNTHLHAANNSNRTLVELARSILTISERPDNGQQDPDREACLQCARYAKALANKNQDIFFDTFGFLEQHCDEIIVVCTVLLLTAFVDFQRGTQGFFRCLLSTELVWAMQPTLRDEWEKLFKIPSTSAAKVGDITPKEIGDTYATARRSEFRGFRLGPLDNAEQLAFFKAYKMWKDEENTWSHIAAWLQQRTAAECILFFQSNKRRLSDELVDVIEEQDGDDGGDNSPENVLQVSPSAETDVAGMKHKSGEAGLVDMDGQLTSDKKATFIGPEEWMDNLVEKCVAEYRKGLELERRVSTQNQGMEGLEEEYAARVDRNGKLEEQRALFEDKTT